MKCFTSLKSVCIPRAMQAAMLYNLYYRYKLRAVYTVPVSDSVSIFKVSNDCGGCVLRAVSIRVARIRIRRRLLYISRVCCSNKQRSE